MTDLAARREEWRALLDDETPLRHFDHEVLIATIRDLAGQLLALTESDAQVVEPEPEGLVIPVDPAFRAAIERQQAEREAPVQESAITGSGSTVEVGPPCTCPELAAWDPEQLAEAAPPDPDCPWHGRPLADDVSQHQVEAITELGREEPVGYVCRYCPASFSTSTERLQHVAISHDRPAAPGGGPLNLPSPLDVGGEP